MKMSTALIIAFVSVIAAAASAQTNVFPSSGNVGIGTTSPAATLHVHGSILASGADFQFVDSGTLDSTAVRLFSAGGALYLQNGSGNATYFRSKAAITNLTILDTGNVGIGTTSPNSKLEINGNLKLTSGSGGSVTFADGTQQTTAWTGVVCGGDYAESVDVSGDRKKFTPGDVLVIDPKTPGKFLKSGEAYSTSVTGIYSTKPGTVGRRQKTPFSPDEVPMAMMGIVPVKATAEGGAIHPGDLLVTSSQVGYAMRGSDRTRMLGAVIGKALGNLESGTGVVEVVVTLQ
jgi:hypothetical protein